MSASPSSAYLFMMRAPFPSASDFALSQLLFIIDAYEGQATLNTSIVLRWRSNVNTAACR